jgi:hypothetical protein
MGMNIRDAQVFMILGAAKCGTTSFYRYLDQHPDLMFSSPKEPVFFEAEYERGLDYYWSEYFADWSGHPVVGEARTHNLMLPYVPARVHACFPGARLAALLRDPIDRAYSHWWHRYSRSLERLPFREALEANLERLESGLLYEGEEGAARWARDLTRNRVNYSTRHGHYLELGCYAEQLERYLALFPSSQLKVFFFENLSADPVAVTREAWKHFGVDASHALESLAAHNTAWDRQRSRLQQKLAGAPLERFQALRRWVPPGLGRAVDRALAGRPAQRPSMARGDEAWLLEYFEPHNRRLEQLLGRPLADWFLPQDRTAR